MEIGDKILMIFALFIGILPALAIILYIVFVLFTSTVTARDVTFVSDTIRPALVP